MKTVETKENNYFCGACGYHFKSSLRLKDENGITGDDLFCPNCGAWCIFPDTIEGSELSLKFLNESENIDIEHSEAY